MGKYYLPVTFSQYVELGSGYLRANSLQFLHSDHLICLVFIFTDNLIFSIPANSAVTVLGGAAWELEAAAGN